MRHAYTRWSRNPVIARTLVEFGWARELNEGVQRVYDEMESFFLSDPIFEKPNDSSMQLTLENSITSCILREQDSLEDRIGQTTLDSLNEYGLAAVRYVYAKERITVGELSKHLGRSVKISRPTLKELERKKIFE